MTASSTPDLVSRILAKIDTHEQFYRLVLSRPRPRGKIHGHAQLRRCAADRSTVERHSRPGRAEARGTQDGMAVLEYCECCGALMPCPDLLDRAEAYGITEEATTS